MAFDFIEAELQQRKNEDLYRTTHFSQSKQGREVVFEGKTYLNFSSNDYLGLASDPALIESWKEGAALYGIGSGGSFLVTGFSDAHVKLCDEIKCWLGVEAVALFSSGYSANQAIIKLLLTKKKAHSNFLFQDKLNHASLIEAGMIAPCVMKRFKHNDMTHLNKLLSSVSIEDKNKLIISEGVFSMDGDQAPVETLSHLANKYNSWLMIDDAHGIGVLGEEGRGCVSSSNIQNSDVDILMATFGKALGVSGAFVAGSQSFIDYLTNFSKPYIYTTSFPPAMAHTILKSIKIVRKDQWRRDKLTSLIQYFHSLAKQHGIVLGSSKTAIQPIIIGSSRRAMEITHSLKKQGFWLMAIRPPTVARGSARLRVTLTVNHTNQDVEHLIFALKEEL